MLIFEYVEWKNFLSTGNSPNRIELNSSPSTLIVGKNGDGKSTILDALSFLLFGKPFRDVNKGLLINSINEKNCLVTGQFRVGTNVYKVERGIKPNIFNIYCNGEQINKDAAVKDYQKVLEQQILKWNHKTFTQVVGLGSANFVPFMQLSAPQRRAVIEDILDISVFSSMNQVLKTKLDETKKTITDINFKIENLKTQTVSQKKLISSMTESKQEKLDDLNQQIRSNNIKIEENSKRSENIFQNIMSLLENVSDKETLEDELNKSSRTSGKLSSTEESLKSTIKFFEQNDTCPQCAQSIPHEHKKSITTKTEELLKNVQDSISETTTLRENLKKKLEDAKKSTDRIQKLKLDQATLESMNKSLKSTNKELSEKILEITKNTSKIDEEKEKLQALIKSAVELLNKKTELMEEKSVQELAALLLKDTGIKTSIIKEYLPIINKMINSYLKAMDFYVHFELDETFNETIKSRFRDSFSYASFSEGEKMRIDLAILFTWREIAKMKNSVNTNLLILDEIFDSSLDNSGTDYFLKLMESFGKTTNVFVISHKGDSLVEKFSQVIKFEKRKDFSVIV